METVEAAHTSVERRAPRFSSAEFPTPPRQRQQVLSSDCLENLDGSTGATALGSASCSPHVQLPVLTGCGARDKDDGQPEGRARSLSGTGVVALPPLSSGTRHQSTADPAERPQSSDAEVARARRGSLPSVPAVGRRSADVATHRVPSVDRGVGRPQEDRRASAIQLAPLGASTRAAASRAASPKASVGMKEEEQLNEEEERETGEEPREWDGNVVWHLPPHVRDCADACPVRMRKNSLQSQPLAHPTGQPQERSKSLPLALLRSDRAAPPPRTNFVSVAKRRDA
ncbi:hypothetical protein STCU_11920 [Strigomonas culicis]|uniref:Uncharacterized protein n=1 Tax=Strigomonas culicis TaxID=28005 RepID=S9UYH3_9TRYP|nr:hypothetical protein STCU_11920 [Strigomonas culicis]|eukprot:EPY15575.1 hypothetical protein STCU_11920 [Strigomonas culicis]